MIDWTVENLIEKYGYWGSHPEYPVEDWRHEVSNDDVRRGYWDWVAAKLEEDGK